MKSYLAALFALTTLGSISTALAATSVTVNFSGQQFGPGQEIHVNSGARVLPAAKSYKYRIEGSCRGTGVLSAVIPPGTSFAELLDTLSDGSSATLSGVRPNPTGALPFSVINRTYAGILTIPVLGAATASLTVKGRITGSGQVRFDVTNVSITVPGFTFSGAVEFEQGSKLIVTAAPLIEFAPTALRVSENAGTVAINVKRRGSLEGEVSARFTTVLGTAPEADFVAKEETVVFAEGETTKTVIVTINDNDADDNSRTFKVKLDQATGGAVLGPRKRIVVTIKDDEL